MKKQDSIFLVVLVLIFALSGCVVRTYSVSRDRIDQDLSAGNRGYLMGAKPAGEEKERKASRTTQVIEVEVRAPIKFEKAPQAQPMALTQPQESKLEPTSTVEKIEAETPVSFEKYTVQKNDTLQKIAKKFYGTTKKWTKIYEANKDTLKGPDKVYVGQVLNIPVESLKEPKENLK